MKILPIREDTETIAKNIKNMSNEDFKEFMAQLINYRFRESSHVMISYHKALIDKSDDSVLVDVSVQVRY